MPFDLEACLVRVCASTGQSLGTGFAIADDLVVTSLHVIDNHLTSAQPICLEFPGGNSLTPDVEVLIREPAEDVAVLRFKSTQSLVPAPLGSADACEGDPVRMIGFATPADFRFQRADDTVSGVVDRSDGRRPMLQLDAGRNLPAEDKARSQGERLGMSGAPVFNLATGRVIGMYNEFLGESSLEWATTVDTLAYISPGLLLRPPDDIEDYLTALAQFCGELPYVTLETGKTPAAMYVNPFLKDIADIGKQHIGADGPPKADLRIDDILSEHARVIIVGSPGAGKSTLGRRLIMEQLVEITTPDKGRCFVLSESTSPLPIVISLPGLCRQRGDMTTRLRSQIGTELGMRLPRPLPENFLFNWSRRTGAGWLILLDGFDEAISIDERRRILREVAHTAWPSASKIIVTSRPDDLLEKTSEFRTFNLLPFTSDQIEEFAHRWFVDDTRRCSSFLKSLRDAHLGSFEGTPLLLTVAAIVFERESNSDEALQQSPLAPFTVALFSSFIETLLAEDASPIREVRAQFIEQLDTDLGRRIFNSRHRLLQEIALAIQDGRGAVLGARDFLQDVPIKLSEFEATRISSTILDIFALRHSGVLTRRGSDYDFVHPTVREFLAARSAVEGSRNNGLAWEQVASRWEDPHWRRVAIFCLGLLPQPDNLAQVTSFLKHTARTEKGLLFAAEALAEQVDVEEGFQGIVIERLGDMAQKMTLSDVLTAMETRNAMELLGQLSTDVRAIAMLRKLATDATVGKGPVKTTVRGWIQRTAASELAKRGPMPEVVPVVLDSTIAVEVRKAAVSGIGERAKLDEGADILVTMLMGLAHDEDVGPAAIESLRKLGRVEELMALARDPEFIEFSLTREIVESLCALGRADELLDLARTSSKSYLPSTAVEMLGKLKRIDLLLSLARDPQLPDSIVVSAIGTLGSLSCWDELLGMVRDEQAPQVRRLIAINQMAEHGRIEDLLKIAWDDQISVLIRVVSIRELGGLKLVPDLLNLAQNSSTPMVRVAAAKEVGERGDRTAALPILLELAHASRLPVSPRRWAAETLGKLQETEAAASVLLELARDTTADSTERFQVARALSQVGREDDAAPLLLALARDIEVPTNIRRLAMEEVTGGDFAETATSLLLELARDAKSDPAERFTATLALCRRGHIDDAAPIMLELAHFSQIASRIMSELKGMGRICELMRVAEDPLVKELIRWEASLTLGELSCADELSALAQNESVDELPRVAAVIALRRLKKVDRLVTISKGVKIGRHVQTEALVSLERLRRDKKPPMGIWRGAIRRGETALLKIIPHRLKNRRQLNTNEIARDSEIDEWFILFPVWKLAELGQPAQLLQLAREYAGVISWVASCALNALGYRNELFALAADPEANGLARVAAAEALCRSDGAVEASRILFELARDSGLTPAARINAAHGACDRYGADEITPVLMELARDSEIERTVRVDAIRLLGRLNRSLELSSLAPNVRNDGVVAEEIANALADMRCSHALLELTLDERLDELVRIAATLALCRIRGIEELLTITRRTRGRTFVAEIAVVALGMFRKTDKLKLLMIDSQVPGKVRQSAGEEFGVVSPQAEVLKLLFTRHIPVRVRIGVLRGFLFSWVRRSPPLLEP